VVYEGWGNRNHQCKQATQYRIIEAKLIMEALVQKLIESSHNNVKKHQFIFVVKNNDLL
jgi:hypothetical protein